MEVGEDIWEKWEVIGNSYGVRRWKWVDLSARRAEHVKIWSSESG